MVSKDYKPSMKPTVESGKDGSTSIRCSAEYVQSLQRELSLMEWDHLQDNAVGQAICPKLWWFSDTPMIRIILKVDI